MSAREINAISEYFLVYSPQVTLYIAANLNFRRLNGVFVNSRRHRRTKSLIPEGSDNKRKTFSTASDDFVAARDFRWRQRTRESRTVGKTWWKDSTNEETIFAAQLFFSKITHSKRLETKYVLDTARKLSKSNFDFFS